MFTHILVPLDGSPLAETALMPAAALARRFGAELLLMRAMLPTDAPEGDSLPERSLLASGSQVYLDRLASQLAKGGITIHTVVTDEEPAEGILAQTKLDQVDLIVMATHGRTGFDALLHPSVTWKVLSRTSAPILVWKQAPAQSSAQELAQATRFLSDPLAPIIVPLDGSLQAEAALPLVQLFAKTFGNPVLLLRVATQPLLLDGGFGNAAIVEDALKWSIEESESYLKVKRAELESQGLTVRVRSMLGPTSTCIKDTVEGLKAGLVVMTSHGRGWLGRLMVGSVAKDLLGQLETPILLVRRVPSPPLQNPPEQSQRADAQLNSLASQK
jgi:nucleotide-binding universal stress UspA family protein